MDTAEKIIEMPMSEDYVFQETKKILDSVNKSGVSVTGDTNIVEDLNVDSLAVMDVVMELEDKFDISIPLNVISNVRTVNELVGAIKKIKEEA
ncbi:MAG: phosphopantetheine-binding protein [Rhodovibrionaceae bacterium]|nr:phosphopantetheine-binding protein [Rhodovibrionaceae bacterium]